jgi:PKD repeat protein
VVLTITDNGGAVASTTRVVTVARTNAAPNAAFSVLCDKRSCTFDGSASTDADGTVASHSWAFGDGSTATGVKPPAHVYTGDGDYVATLTVTDNEGASSTSSRTVSVRAAQTPISFRGASFASNSGTSISAQVPAAAQPGDGLVMIITTNLDTVDVSAPTGVTGWQRVDSVAGQTMRSELWQKVAAAGDAGKTIQVIMSGNVKADVEILAYAGTSSAGPVLDYASAFETELRAEHSTPTLAVANAGTWVLSYWADKTSATTSWVVPNTVTVRSQSIGQGSGRITSLVADSGAPVAAGSTYGPIVATANSANRKAAMWTVALRQAG